MSMHWSIPRSTVQLNIEVLTCTFQLIFKTYKDKKKFEQLDKDPKVFLKDRNEQFKFEQKPIEIDDFNNLEEEEVRKKIEKTKTIREVAEKYKSLKRKKKLEDENIEEKELWDKLNNLNKEFQANGNIKKKQKKMSKPY